MLVMPLTESPSVRIFQMTMSNAKLFSNLISHFNHADFWRRKTEMALFF